MLLATWNINGMRARFDFLLHWLRSRKPDIVGLQELKMTDENFPFAELREEGYFAVAHTQKAWNGVAILSRTEPELKQMGLPGQEEFGSRLVSARIGSLEFITVYCPNGKSLDHPDFTGKLGWFDDLAHYLKSDVDPGSEVVICGDFNICPAGIDSWDEERLEGTIFHTAEERERMERLYEWGFRDLFRVGHPDTQAFSWWDYRGGAFYRNQGLRIDFLLGTDSVAKQLESVEIDREYRKKQEGMTASDHAPVLASLKAR